METLDLTSDEAVAALPETGDARHTDRDGATTPEAPQQHENHVKELQDAILRIGRLSGHLYVCAYCRRIGDGHHNWRDLNGSLAVYSEARLGHTICRDCYEAVIKPESELLYEYLNESGEKDREGTSRSPTRGA